MKVAVLGATGFIGSWATRALVAAGSPVVALVRPASKSWRLDGVRNVEIVRSNDWSSTVAAIAPEAILSLDWSGVLAADRVIERVQHRNVQRLGDIASAAFAAGTRRFVGVGSQAEYGPFDERVGEQRRPAPTTAYGRAKVAASEVLAAAALEANAQFVWARVFSVFGPLETGERLFPSLARAAATGSPMALTKGTQPWCGLYAADAGAALAELVLNPRASGIYNVGHPAAPPLREALEVYVAALGGTALAQFGDMPGPRLEADVSRLQELGWSPAFDMSEALVATATWMRGEPLADPLVPGMIPQPAR